METLTKGCYDVYSRLLGGVPMFVMFFMLERPAGYWSVGKQKWVDGVHIHAPRGCSVTWLSTGTPVSWCWLPCPLARVSWPCLVLARAP